MIVNRFTYIIANLRSILWAVAGVRRPGERQNAHQLQFRWASDFTNGERRMTFRRAKPL